ncbi:MAP kinase phosphatase [Ephemerocybe angulata]|uniref:protein-tyrosine-phosphatase n=1 Tax=Ephemerocybe angulata TaxID=980116 RepID=A0A8H6HM49_9AGAR|nr:MAP kinase phosphatase [Tulosesus angulatus]
MMDFKACLSCNSDHPPRRAASQGPAMVNDHKIPRSPLPGKRFRPPTLDISQAIERRPSIQLETETPVSKTPSSSLASANDSSDDDDEFEDTLQLSSPESEGAGSPIIPVIKADGADDILQEIAKLERLRNSVKQNLKLRPIKSRTNLKGADGATPNSHTPGFQPTSSSSVWSDRDDILDSAISTTSDYFTPVGDAPPTSMFINTSASESFPILDSLTPRPPTAVSPKALYDRLTGSKRPLLIDTRPLAAHEAFHIRHSINVTIPSLILRRSKKPGGGFPGLEHLRTYITTEGGKRIWDELMDGSWDGDVVIYDDDMDVKDRDNMGVTAWAIMPVITPLLSYGTVDYLEGGLSSAGHDPDLQTLIVTGDEASPREVQAPTLGKQQQPQKQQRQQKALRKGSGLFQLDTQTTYRTKQLPELEPSSTVSLKPPGLIPPPLRSPLPMMPSSVSSSSSSATSTDSSLTDSPSPPPSSIAGFRRPPPPPRRPSAPNLRLTNAKSMERLTLNTNLPKLSLRTKPMRSATIGGPPSLTLQVPTSPTHLKLFHSNHSPVTPRDHSNSGQVASPTNDNDPRNYMTPYFTPPHTPKASFGSFGLAPHPHHHPTHLPLADPPPTARGPNFDLDLDQPPTTEDDAFPTFTVSTILPNFLFLGPELTTPEHVEALQELGVKRILNIAAECDDDHGLGLRQVFEKYLKIPMRDTVEEDNITRGVREVCDYLDDARLHSAPTYVHCKAGKSRSVTAVMAYLIHANRWTLSRAYSFVLERRKGISPNIGFVSELMNFEEQELGNKSIGVQPTASAGGGDADMQSGFSAAVSGRSRAHVRESLPPQLGMEGLIRSATTGGMGLGSGGLGSAASYGGESGAPSSGVGPVSAGVAPPTMDAMDRVMGDAGQEVEVKDASGRYRHVRRAPVNENTLQPMRRVSKAGLESSFIMGKADSAVAVD